MNQDKMYQAFLNGTLDEPEPHFGTRWMLVSLGLGLLFMFLGQQLLLDFWFEDDTNILFYVQKYTNPIAYFFDIETMRALSPARTLTPMQPLSFLFDYSIAGERPWFFYAHVIAVAIATQAVLWIYLRRLTNPMIASFASLCWLMNPATLAVTEFISARHYLEGLLLVGLAGLCAIRAVNKEKWQDQALWGLLAFICYLLGSACKELSVTNGFWLIVAIFIQGRKWRLAILSVISFLLYFAYRNWAIGLIGQGFDKDWSILWDYEVFLSWIPFMLTGSRSGIFVFAIGAVLIVLALANRKITLKEGFWWSTHIAIALATILPVSIHWMASAENHGTWYRVGFILNTCWIALLAWLIHRLLQQRHQLLLLIPVTICFAMGSYPAIDAWDQRKADVRPLAQFYIQNPDRLLYTELPGIFFLGWHNLHEYGQPQRFITRTMNARRAEQILMNYKTIWRKQGDSFVSDDTLYNKLLYNATHERIPLDRQLPQAVTPNEAPVFARHEAVFEDQKLVIYRKRNDQILSQHVLPPEITEPGTHMWAWPRAFVKEICLGLLAQQPTRVVLIWPENTRQVIELEPGIPQKFNHLLEENFTRPLLARIESEGPLKIWSFALTQQDFIQQGSPVAERKTDALFPHFPKASSGWESRIALINLNATETNVAVTWYDQDGSAMRNTYNLAPGPSFLPAPSQHAPISAVVAATPGTICFQTWQIFEERQSFVFTPAPPVKDEAPYYLSIPNTEKATPSLAFWNPNDQVVSLRLIDQNNNELISKQLNPFEKWAYVPISTQIPVHVQSDAPITGLALWRSPWQQWTMAACVPTSPSIRAELISK
jgi:hypothetical protein